MINKKKLPNFTNNKFSLFRDNTIYYQGFSDVGYQKDINNELLSNKATLDLLTEEINEFTNGSIIEKNFRFTKGDTVVTDAGHHYSYRFDTQSDNHRSFWFIKKID
ncbi:MAG: hypothetical protein A2X01_09190 [Bacteroidetes bacterium GWF2_35_48]|nr:MAG: hypothetical protein A2X01_09190 [Bacteroidetes bacterium GWF2_35_48]